MRRFVIPDVHGCFNTLRTLVQDVLRLTPEDTLYFLGDLIDRGPRSREVLDFIMGLQAAGYSVSSVRGNHEQMFLDGCRDRNLFRLWMINGGGATLASFGVEDPCEIPTGYRRFCNELPYYIKADDAVIVHAGLNLMNDDPFADTETMIWTRHQVGDSRKLGGRRVVCGHTPVPRKRMEATLKTDCIMLDNGCVFSGTPGLGSLAALNLDDLTLHFQENIDF